MFLHATAALTQTTQAVSNACDRLGTTNFQWLAWPQTWPNSACGRATKGVVMHAFCDAQTVIASGESDAVLVYHNGHYVYTIENPNDRFWEACGQRKLPGEQDIEAQEKLESKPAAA